MQSISTLPMCSHLYWWHLRAGQKAKIQMLQKEADKLVRVATNIYIFWAKAEAGWIEERLIGVVTKRSLIHASASSPRLLLSPCHLSPNREFFTCICLLFSVTRRYRSDEYDSLTYWTLALTWLMWPWWVMIPIEDFTDVILITLMTLLKVI